MTRREYIASVAALLPSLALSSRPGSAASTTGDRRDIRNGFAIPRENYSDQPYVVITNDGSWLCVLTTGKSAEGQHGQHVISTISTDQGRTWSAPVDIEPADGPEASWVMPFQTPGGRVYVFYDYNRDSIREVPNCNSKAIAQRVDTLGAYMFKYSDDHGRTWSKERFEIPMRLMRIDRENNFDGRALQFWGVGKPMVQGSDMYFGFAKVGKQGQPGTFVVSRGCIMRSDNILVERDPRKLRWELLPADDEGLRAPKGPIAEETNLTSLSDGTLYAVYRTIDGCLCHAYSRDHGRTWTGPEYATYSPGGRRIKQPRAFACVRKFSNGKYLLWYHNHGGEAVHLQHWDYYKGRNPGWVSGGVEKNGRVHWSEPEILLYDDDPEARISYPDFIEDRGRYFITETQKSLARVHEIDRTLLDGLWNQFENRSLAREGLLLHLTREEPSRRRMVRMPRLASLSERRGFTIDFHVRFRELSPGQTILDARDSQGRGIRIGTSDRFTLELRLHDGRQETAWDSDPGTGPGTLRVGVWQHVAVVVDAGPRLILFIVDGVLNDGGALRQYGWGRIPSDLGDVNGAEEAKFAPVLYGDLAELRIYGRALCTSELLGNYRAGIS